MGKQKLNKGPTNKGKRDKPVALTSIKKTKTKAVSSNLKKINLQNKAKTEKADEAFKAVREAVMGQSKTAKTTPVSKKQHQPTTSDSAEDMESTMENFAKL